MALDVTVGGASSNSYATLAEADSYHDGHVARATWLDVALAPKRELAMRQAARMLDHYVTWKGAKTADSQALQWPRTGIVDKDTDDTVSSSLIPAWLKNAQSELARLLLEGDLTAESAGIESLRFGDVAVTFTGAPGNLSAPIPPSVRMYTNPYAWRTAGSMQKQMVRV